MSDKKILNMANELEKTICCLVNVFDARKTSPEEAAYCLLRCLNIILTSIANDFAPDLIGQIDKNNEENWNLYTKILFKIQAPRKNESLH